MFARLSLPASVAWFAFSTVSIGWITGDAVLAEDAKASKPNFVIILADDMGYGDSSVYDGWLKTPNLERMAQAGLTFSDFHSSGVVCSPTRAGLMTGRYQQRAGIPGVVYADPARSEHEHGIQPQEITFAEQLSEAGYATAIFGKWHLGYRARYNPTHHGFDQFRGFVSGNVDYISHYDQAGAYDWWRDKDLATEDGYLTELITRHSTRFIRENKDQPFCLYVPHGAVHSPIQAPDSPAGRGPTAKKESKLSAKEQERRIREMMKLLDSSVGAILDELEEQDISENTFVLFFSDNGGAKHMRNDPLRGGKGTVWEGGHRVPAIAVWPGRIKANSKSAQTCISLDVMPTLLELAGVEPDPIRKLDGISLAGLLLDEEKLPARQLYWNGTAMRDGPWKLVIQQEKTGSKSLLFNLDADLEEQNDLATQHPDKVALMMKSLEAWREDVASGATPQPGKAE